MCPQSSSRTRILSTQMLGVQVQCSFKRCAGKSTKMKAEGLEHQSQREGLWSQRQPKEGERLPFPAEMVKDPHILHIRPENHRRNSSFQALGNRQHGRGPSEKGHEHGTVRRPPLTAQRASRVPEKEDCKEGRGRGQHRGPQKLPPGTDQRTRERILARLGRNHKKGAHRSFPALTCMQQHSVPTLGHVALV